MTKLFTEVVSAGIFRRGAEVIRRGSCELKQGQDTLYVFGLSSSADQESVRLLSSEQLLARDLRFLNKEDEDRLSLKYEEEIADLQKQIDVKNLQISLWESNGDFSNRHELSADVISDYIEKLPVRISSLHKEIRDLEKKIRELKKKQEEEAGIDVDPVVAVDLNVEKEGTYHFELRYQENAASWNPVYEIQAKEGEDLEVLSKARIFQNTSEDWKDVEVSLLSSNPNTSGIYADPDPVYLDFREEMPRGKMAMGAGRNIMLSANAMVMEDAVAMDMEEVAEAPMSRVRMEEAEFSQDDTFSEYRLSGKRTIRKGENGNLADLKKETVKAEYLNISAPKKDPNVYLIARIKTKDLPFEQEISAAIYLNDVFSRNAAIYPDLSEEHFDLTLGKQEQIHVSYKEAARKTAMGLLKRSTEYVYEALFNNVSDKDKQITFKDQLPVSQNKDINVESNDLGGCKLEEETGILSKTFELPAKSSETIRIAYKVSYPKDKKIKESSNMQRTYCPECGSPMKGKICPSCGYRR